MAPFSLLCVHSRPVFRCSPELAVGAAPLSASIGGNTQLHGFPSFGCLSFGKDCSFEDKERERVEAKQLLGQLLIGDAAGDEGGDCQFLDPFGGDELLDRVAYVEREVGRGQGVLGAQVEPADRLTLRLTVADVAPAVAMREDGEGCGEVRRFVAASIVWHVGVVEVGEDGEGRAVVLDPFELEAYATQLCLSEGELEGSEVQRCTYRFPGTVMLESA